MAEWFGLAVFTLWWSMTTHLSEYEGTDKGGRPGLSAAFGLLGWTLMSWGPLGVFLALAGAGYSVFMYWQLWRAMHPAKQPEPPSPPTVETADSDGQSWRDYAFPTKPRTPPEDGADDPLAKWRDQSVEVVRERSLRAMKRAGSARKHDKSRRGEKDAARLGYTNDYIDIDARKPKSVSGDDLGVVAFDYLNQQGDFSNRRVRVQWVGEWKFDGIDLDKHAERSFRYDSIIGDITDQDTGEVLSPHEWRDMVRG